jgi:hypothetical protein
MKRHLVFTFFILVSAGITQCQETKGQPTSIVGSSEVGKPKGNEDVRYLLVRRAGRPERNYYELTRTATFFEPQLCNDELISQLKPPPSFFCCDIISEYTVRYGVYQAWKVRVIGTSDSQGAPTSTKDSVYVLVYARHPDWKFCARKYRIESSSDGARKIIYTDFQDGREYTFELSPKWPRPWQIYEVEIQSSNAFPEIWQASKERN